MSRLTRALVSVVADLSGADLARILDVPKRTADRWLAELRGGDLENWSGAAIERLASWEAREWGTLRISDALRPESHIPEVRGKADAATVARIMQAIIASHQVNARLLGEMAIDLSDGVLHDHEARRLLPLVVEAQQTSISKHRELGELRLLLENRLANC
jgi:hypothetical protein